MKNSLSSPTASNAVLRLTRWILPAILAGSMATGCTPQAAPGPQAAPASQGGVVGQLRTVLQGSTYTITIQANGQYMQVGVPQNGGMTLAQGGPYQLISPNIIAFTVTDWSPKTKLALVPCGIPGDPVCNREQVQPVAQPPNSSYTYRFNGPNTMILSNPNTREVITFTRVTAQ